MVFFFFPSPEDIEMDCEMHMIDNDKHAAVLNLIFNKKAAG